VPKNVVKWAEEIDEGLRSDCDFNQSVHVVTKCGSTFFLSGAVQKDKGDWYVVFTEHFGILYFHKDDLNEMRQFIDD